MPHSQQQKRDATRCQECDEKVPFIDFIEPRLKSDPVARKILAMDETAIRELDTLALEQNEVSRSLSALNNQRQSSSATGWPSRARPTKSSAR